MLDNTALLYSSIQRTYRNALVAHIRDCFTTHFGDRAYVTLQDLFAKKDEATGIVHWERIRAAAQERRQGGTSELSMTIRDDFELLGVEYFFNVFDKHFDILCSAHANKPKKEKAQARQALTVWMKTIKNVRDPISHPITDDVSFEDANNVLYHARKILDFCGLPNAAAQVQRQQRSILGGYHSETERILALLPPADEVVTDFVGRHREIAILQDWLRKNQVRRWALSGEGGKGKSAIAYTFAKSVATQDDLDLQGVLWISAKRKRFIEGSTLLVNRPDFHDKSSALTAILQFFGDTPTDDVLENEEKVLRLLRENPTLLIVDDIDTVEGEADDAIQLFLFRIPETTPSKVLITSRRALFGIGNLTTQVEGLTAQDAEDFIKSRCDFMGIPLEPILRVKDKILEVTDASPLFVEDLLRLAHSGMHIDKVIGLWSEKRGSEARKYGIQREYDKLGTDARLVLLALSLHGPCPADDICHALDWNDHRLVEAMNDLKKMFLLPKQSATQVLAVNRNTQLLVLEAFSGTDAYRRTDRLMKAAAGRLAPEKRENQRVADRLQKLRWTATQGQLADAESQLTQLVTEFPGRADILSNLAWVQKKNGDTTAARGTYRRAHELGCQDRDAYWHWSELEDRAQEWQASEDAATAGLDKFGEEQGLLFRQGYAIHRQGKELIQNGVEQSGRKRCQQAQGILERAASLRSSEDRNFSLRYQILRAIAVNLEMLGDEPALARHFARWFQESPGDSMMLSEYERLRSKFPRYLSAR